jgi:hypothetical protein
LVLLHLLYLFVAKHDLMNQMSLKNSYNTFNIDTLALLVDQMSPGEPSIVELYKPESQLGDSVNDGKMDLILAARKLLDEEFGGVSL